MTLVFLGSLVHVYAILFVQFCSYMFPNTTFGSSDMHSSTAIAEKSEASLSVRLVFDRSRGTISAHFGTQGGISRYVTPLGWVGEFNPCNVYAARVGDSH